ncbi:hypothetical protein [Arthrobacter sp. ISL-28]|uniref:hypothetical protein n=1 Tax=Arthrobacter sp. ISL-28 TaxID=2819108 RepID=UPI001BE959B4|nr:hypothetical protein [Arthrobacter sp. ISL-28]MBT2522916.1 hypothetical protein [Arthrobacter sp. ISL-28]
MARTGRGHEFCRSGPKTDVLLEREVQTIGAVLEDRAALGLPLIVVPRRSVAPMPALPDRVQDEQKRHDGDQIGQSIRSPERLRSFVAATSAA